MRKILALALVLLAVSAIAPAVAVDLSIGPQKMVNTESYWKPACTDGMFEGAVTQNCPYPPAWIGDPTNPFPTADKIIEDLTNPRPMGQ
jgi:hypothetical protein